MSAVPVLGSPAPRGLLGVLRSWLQSRSNAVGPTSRVAPIETGASKVHDYGSVQVLVVDDNPVHLMMISALMESRGLVPWLAADGAEAVALASELHFDLILMDLQMPILDGLGATSAIRRSEAERSRPEVPVIAFSTMPPGAGFLATRGLNGSLIKPCADQELEDCLVRWCPTYRSAPAVYGAARGNSGWRAVSRVPAPSSSPLR